MQTAALLQKDETAWAEVPGQAAMGGTIRAGEKLDSLQRRLRRYKGKKYAKKERKEEAVWILQVHGRL